MRVSLRLLAASAALVLTASAVPASQAEPVPSAPTLEAPILKAPTARAAAAPKVGRCFDVSIAKASKAALTAKTVKCSKPHTLWVVGNAKLPAGLPVNLGDPASSVAARERCVSAVRKKIGGYATPAYARSTYGYFLFQPTAAQQRRGARWITCAVGHWNAGQLLRTKQAKPPKVAATMPSAYTLCATSSRQWVGCARPHAYRSTYSTMVAFDGRLTDAKVRQGAQAHCAPRMGGRAYTYGSRGVVGQKYALVCLKLTSS